jgi:hypothetical protein
MISRKPKNKAFSRRFDEDRCNKSSVAPTTQQIGSGGDIYAQGVDV